MATVVLIESIARLSTDSPTPSEDLLDLALRAGRSPLVTGFGWVSSREKLSGLDELRNRGKPFGVLRPSPLLEIRVDEHSQAKATKTVLIDEDVAERAADVGALTLEQAAAAIAEWIVDDGTRRGATLPVRGVDRPVEEAVRALGYEPLVLTRWRVSLNRALGMTVLEDRDGVLGVRRKSWFRRSRARSEYPVINGRHQYPSFQSERGIS